MGPGKARLPVWMLKEWDCGNFRRTWAQAQGHKTFSGFENRHQAFPQEAWHRAPPQTCASPGFISLNPLKYGKRKVIVPDLKDMYLTPSELKHVSPPFVGLRIFFLAILFISFEHVESWAVCLFLTDL